MNIKTKKLIAREFLVLMLCVTLTLLTFIFIYPYNFYKKNQTDRLNVQISAKKLQADSLLKSYKNKTENQFWFTGQYTFTFGLPNEEYTNAKVWNRLYQIVKRDSLRYKWNTWDKDVIAFHKEMGFENPSQFQAFILENTATPNDIESKYMALSIKSEADVLTRKAKKATKDIIQYREQLRITYLAFIISLCCLFICRYIIYGVKWSIKTLNQV